MLKMPGRSYQGPLLPLTYDELIIKQKIKKHIHTLAENIGERHIGQYQNLQRAAHYIETLFSDRGYEVLNQRYDVAGKSVRNIEVIFPGTTKRDEIIVIGAHYDTALKTMGADDNASGVAALLVIARDLAQKKFPRTLRFVAFTNEEPPHFLSQDMGSYHYARRSHQRGENIVAMFSIESIGYYVEQAGSQRYPFPLKYFYPDRGNFIGFVSNLSSRQLLRQSLALFRAHTLFPSEGTALPSWMPGIGWSDQNPFWQYGYPAVMITDTVPFRNPHYHAASDTPDTLNYNHMARVILGLEKMITALAES